MAGRYLPTEMQNDEGDVIYPHSEADIIWTQTGKSVEEVLSEKAEIIVSAEQIPVDQRKTGAMYFIVEGASPTAEAAVAMAGPAVGYKVL